MIQKLLTFTKGLPWWAWIGDLGSGFGNSVLTYGLVFGMLALWLVDLGFILRALFTM